MYTDYIMNGIGHGEVGQRFAGTRFEKGLMRPFLARNKSGREVMSVMVGEGDNRELIPVTDLASKGMHCPIQNVSNAATGLRKDDWKLLDKAVIASARKRLRAWADLATANTFNVNGMSKSLLEHETITDGGVALVDMDGTAEARHDEPKYQLEGLPLPITHSGFSFSERKLSISRNSGTPLDTTMASQCGRRVAEHIEKTLIGVNTGMTYGVTADYGRAPTVFGYTNFTDRLTDTTGTDPTGSNGPTVLSDWLGYRDALYNNNMFGPFMVYTSTGWDQYLDNLFSTTEPSAGTLRKRLLEIDGITDIKRLDFLTTDFTTIFVQMDPEVARAVVGMDLTTIQWDSIGGLQKNFKVMAIMVPQLRADDTGQCGILHASH